MAGSNGLQFNKTIVPKKGKTIFVAVLKNSRLD
jgi:hypothetical protein